MYCILVDAVVTKKKKSAVLYRVVPKNALYMTAIFQSLNIFMGLAELWCHKGDVHSKK